MPLRDAREPRPRTRRAPLHTVLESSAKRSPSSAGPGHGGHDRRWLSRSAVRIARNETSGTSCALVASSAAAAAGGVWRRPCGKKGPRSHRCARPLPCTDAARLPERSRSLKVPVQRLTHRPVVSIGWVYASGAPDALGRQCDPHHQFRRQDSVRPSRDEGRKPSREAGGPAPAQRRRHSRRTRHPATLSG